LKVTTLEIIPAIDIRGGRCVRLYQGDYGRETVYSDDPVDTALYWQSLGASRIHIVDLDGAASGKPGNYDIIREIANAVLIPTQLGGGIRDMETVEMYLKAEVDRVILGTIAIEDPWLVGEACRRYSDSVVVSIDTKDGYVATRGWQLETKMKTVELVDELSKLGVKRIVYTDISRDGTLTEPNFAQIYELTNHTRMRIIASGGVANINHLQLLQKLGVEGAIVGKALYTGDVKLKQALEIINRQP
jgi:phosphoribosylformimino-5-aminoimidazole carboxamide ribotide isomerase